MEELIKKYDDVISLGNNCGLKMYFSKYLDISKETDFFDYIGTPIWAIVELLKNDFNNLLNKNEFIYRQNFVDNSGCCMTNARYDLKFRHDFPKLTKEKISEYKIKDNEFNYFKEKIIRRKNRLKSKITNLKKILFIRLEEQLTNKIIPEKFIEKYRETEYDYIKEIIIELKKINPKLEVTVIYLTKKLKNNYIKEDNIITLECDINMRIDILEIIDKIKEVFDTNSDYIKSIVI